MAERQQEYKEKLQGICDLLTQTENRLIGHQEAFVIGDGTVELKKYQSKQEVKFGFASAGLCWYEVLLLLLPNCFSFSELQYA